MSSRRDFLAVAGSAFSGLLISSDLEKVRAALDHARRIMSGEIPPVWEFLTPEQAEDLEAITSQIIPSEPGSPGAREAGVVYYFDKDLAQQDADDKAGFTRGLAALNADIAARWPGTTRFSALSHERQLEFLKAREKDEFFQAVRTDTIMGFFGNPSYGGNKDGLGWKLIGFEDRFVWQPPFGDYDAPAPQGGR